MKKKMTGMLLAVVMAAALMLSGCSVTGSLSGNEDTTEEETITEEISEEPEESVEEEEETEAETETEIVEEELDVESEDASTEVQFGTNQNDAVLVPLDTKIYGTLSSGYYWCSFTTGSSTEADYQITLMDKSADSYGIVATVYDDYGTKLGSGEASPSGLAVTFSAGELTAGTTYYIQMSYPAYRSEVDTDFMLIIRDLNSASSGIATSDSIATNIDEENITAATNMDDAELVPTETRIGSILESGYQYFAFTTAVDGEYKVTLVDVTVDSYGIVATVYDDYGTKLGSGEASPDGLAVTFSAGELTAGTTYYIQMSYPAYRSEVETEYTFTIREPETTDETVATIIEEEDLIFSTPYEINATQVQFVINSAEFIDEEAAKEAVEPVAEALLAYPEHSILIAGTTATDGTQESCVKLSERRAEAVKNLLVEEFGVPESQIETIGLGYEADPFERGQDRVVEGDITSKFVESEGKKNRRVVIMDIDSDIAQEILAAN